MKTAEKTVEAVCLSCGGTGLYHGFAEPPDTAVVCINCGGTGCHKISYTPFVARKRRAPDGVKYVQQSRGSFILSCGPVGTRITVREFYDGKLPRL
jgi:hypothetical protein